MVNERLIGSVRSQRSTHCAYGSPVPLTRDLDPVSCRQSRPLPKDASNSAAAVLSPIRADRARMVEAGALLRSFAAACIFAALSVVGTLSDMRNGAPTKSPARLRGT